MVILNKPILLANSVTPGPEGEGEFDGILGLDVGEGKKKKSYILW